MAGRKEIPIPSSHSVLRGDTIMATNFRITAHRNGGTLHLKLVGDFDGTSAHELLNTLKKRGDHTSRVFIDTGSLRNIYPFGLNVFHTNLNILKGQSLDLVFTGEHAPQFETVTNMHS
jgi:anti-anti-sigma regulatory factor